MRRPHLPATVALVVAVSACAADPEPSPTPRATASPTAAATPGATPAATGTATGSPTPSPAEPLVGFEAAAVPDTENSSSVTAVLPGGDGLVAIGFDGRFGSMLWTSADGLEWREVTPPGFESIGLAGAIRASDGRLIAVGRGDTLNTEADAAAAFVSDDGLDWRPAPGASGLRGQMITLIEADDGFVAVGGTPGADSAGLWRSADGETWERIGEDEPGSFFWSVAEGASGLVIVGWRRNPEPDVAVWTSRDGGATLELADDPRPGTLSEATDVVATESGRFVLVGGSIAGGEPRIWTSDDGTTWTLAEIEGDLEAAFIRSVVATPAGLIAVGGIGVDAAAWRSTDDGSTWAPFGEPVPDAYFHDAAVTDEGLYLFGATQTGTLESGIEAHAAIWVADLED